ncbi:putative DMT superfamily transporter inner membrane protein [Salmonella enterica subsp. enterica serovar Kentucky str. ATCC 9263]|nr:putative DMT superfamily transporter inner membrane protein [Salmonella enterica subsp. enterica serovar Kentucky str. ATCC 9263]
MPKPAARVNAFLFQKDNYNARQHNNFDVYYIHPFYFTVSDYAFPAVITSFGALLPCTSLGVYLFVIRIGVESWPPLMMAGVRFLSAGMLLMAFLLLRGEKLPPLRQTINAALIGLLLLAVGNGLVTVAEHQNVPSGIAAVVVATVPLFTLCFSYFFGIKTRKLEWVGIAIGLAGIILLNSGGNLSGNPWGAILILIGSMSWAFGSVYGSRIALPVGMMAGAIEMLAAGVVLLCAAFLSGESSPRCLVYRGLWPSVTWRCSVLLSPLMPICT